MKIVLLYTLLTSAIIKNVSSARILFFVPTPSISHQLFFQPIWRALSERGHAVTVITTDPLNDPTLTNLTEIDVSFSYESIKKISFQKFLSSTKSRIGQANFLTDLSYKILEEQVRSPQVEKIFNDKSKRFDLVIVESLYLPLYALAYKYNATIIGATSLEGSIPIHNSIGNPTHPILYKDVMLEYDQEMSFWDRLDSTIYYLLSCYNYLTYSLPTSQELTRRLFGNDVPDLNDLVKNISLQIVSKNPIFGVIRPNVPALLELSFIHVKPPKPLPKDLKDILDNAKEGLIYFSLGSNVKSILLSNEMKTMIKSALSELPYTVLWKWEDDDMKDKPENVIIRKWLPQQDILAHRNIKAFVTQGGLQSSEEALFSGVPVVVIPFFGDQPKNAASFERFGTGIALNKETMTKDVLKEAIMTVASDPGYKKRAEEVRDIARDEPIKSLDKAVWWIEYVIRHKGARHLRSPALDVPTYQYLLLDVISYILGVVFLIVFLAYKILSFAMNKIIRRMNKRGGV